MLPAGSHLLDRRVSFVGNSASEGVGQIYVGDVSEMPEARATIPWRYISIAQEDARRPDERLPPRLLVDAGSLPHNQEGCGFAADVKRNRGDIRVTCGRMKPTILTSRNDG